jgi:sugar/nucleoside kinase (ribokinase family)
MTVPRRTIRARVSWGAAHAFDSAMTTRPRLLVVGHVTWDRTGDCAQLGGSAAYASMCALRLGWEAAILTAAGPDFEPARDLPGVRVFRQPSADTTRFENVYGTDGTRQQRVLRRASDIVLDPLADEWRDPDVLLISPVVGEVPSPLTQAFEAATVGAIAQGWLRAVDADGHVEPCEWPDAARQLAGIHALCLSESDLPDADARAREWLRWVPLVAVTRGWRGLTLLTREMTCEVPSLPTEEVDPTGAGDVFATAFLVRYHETGNPLEAAAFGAVAAACVVEGPGFSTLGDRAEIARRLERRERMIEDGEWDE